MRVSVAQALLPVQSFVKHATRRTAKSGCATAPALNTLHVDACPVKLYYAHHIRALTDRLGE